MVPKGYDDGNGIDDSSSVIVLKSCSPQKIVKYCPLLAVEREVHCMLLTNAKYYFLAIVDKSILCVYVRDRGDNSVLLAASTLYALVADCSVFFNVVAFVRESAELKRKVLPQWLREGLEKLERERMKKLEREAREAAHDDRPSRPSWRDELDDEEVGERTQKNSGEQSTPRSYRHHIRTHPSSPGAVSNYAEPHHTTSALRVCFSTPLG